MGDIYFKVIAVAVVFPAFDAEKNTILSG